MMDSKSRGTILHLIDTTGPGGAETVFIQLADLTRKKGYRSIVVIRGPGWVEDTLRRRGLDPIVMDSKGSFALGFLCKLYFLIVRERIAIIQSHLLGSNVYAAILGILTGRPVIATYHGMVDVDPNERFKWLKNRVMRWGIRRYVAVSHSLAKQIESKKLLDSSKTEIIYNGVSSEPSSHPRCESLKQKLGLDDRVILAGSLGNVRPAKAYNVLIEAAALIVPEQQDLHFVIAGHQKSTLMAELTRRMVELNVSDRIHFIGFVDNVQEFLDQIDLFVLSSTSEGFSIATIEAMMGGKPVLVTRCGGPEEIVTHKVTGWMVEPGDHRALAEGVQTLIEDAELRGKLAARGQTHAASTFSLDTMINRYLNVYDAVVKSPAGVRKSLFG